MSKVNVVRRCFNCGAILQNEDPSKEGYISKESDLLLPLNHVLFCDKCYSEANFSSSSLKAGDDLLLMMKDAAASDALIVYIINLFSFESSFIAEVNETIKHNPILVIANKRDLFSENITDDFLKEYVAHRFRVSSLPISAKDVILTSLVSFGKNDFITKEIEKRRTGHDVYILSSRGAGKRMFLSSYLYHFQNRSNRSIQTKACRGASLPVLQIPLDNSSTLFDTPPLVSTNSIDGKLEKDVSDSLLFSSPVKTKKAFLKTKEIFAVGGVCFIELLRAKKNKDTEIHLFFAPNVTTKKIGAYQDLESLIPSYLSKRGIFPKSLVVRELKDLDAFDIEVEEDGDRSIGIQGLGWFSFLGNHQTFRIYVPKGVSVYTSRSKILSYGNLSKK